MQLVKCLAAVLFLTSLVAPAFAADEPKKGKKDAAAGRGFATQVAKMLESAKLTEEQSSKIKEISVKAQAESEKIRKDGGLGPEVAKKLAEARKKVNDEGKKGKEAQEAVRAAVELSPDQTEAMKAADAVLAEARKDIYALLTDEQRNSLPEQAQKALRGPPAKETPKKKKAA
jgi:Spy/CpxP family protein refolding chaperone